MRVEHIERTLELLHEHINGLDRAWGRADGLFAAQLEKQISGLRTIVIQITNMITEALAINNGTSVDGFDTETIPWDWGHLGDNDMRLLESLWQQHFKSIESATENGDFLTERMLSEMRDNAQGCWNTVAKSRNEWSKKQ